MYHKNKTISFNWCNHHRTFWLFFIFLMFESLSKIKKDKHNSSLHRLRPWRTWTKKKRMLRKLVKDLWQKGYVRAISKWRCRRWQSLTISQLDAGAAFEGRPTAAAARGPGPHRTKRTTKSEKRVNLAVADHVTFPRSQAARVFLTLPGIDLPRYRYETPGCLPVDRASVTSLGIGIFLYLLADCVPAPSTWGGSRPLGYLKVEFIC